MLPRLRAFPVGLACVLTGLTAAVAHAGGPQTRTQPDCAAPPVELPLVSRGSLEPDVAALPAEPPVFLGAVSGDIRYRLLRAIECQCQAVLYSSVGNLLARERARLAELHKCCQDACLQFLLPRQCDQRAVHLKL